MNADEAIDFDSLFNEAHDSLEDGDAAAAVTLFNQLAELRPRDPDVWLNLGSAYFELGQLEQAETAWQTCLEADPWQAEAMYNLANLQLDRGNFALALTFIEGTIDCGKAHWPEAWHIRAQLEGYLGHTDRSTRFFGQALQMYLEKHQKTHSVEDLFQIACVQACLFQSEAAIETLRQVIDQDASYRERARADKDFKGLSPLSEFQSLVSQA